MTNNIKPRFGKHPLPGDSIVWRNGWVTLTARIEFDDATRPGEFDCYSEEDIKRWEAVEWRYVGIVVSAEYGGWLLDDTAASLWGLECGLTEDSGDYLSEIAAELFAEALQVATEALQVATEALQVAKVEMVKLRTAENTEE